MRAASFSLSDLRSPLSVSRAALNSVTMPSASLAILARSSGVVAAAAGAAGAGEAAASVADIAGVLSSSTGSTVAAAAASAFFAARAAFRSSLVVVDPSDAASAGSTVAAAGGRCGRRRLGRRRCRGRGRRRRRCRGGGGLGLLGLGEHGLGFFHSGGSFGHGLLALRLLLLLRSAASSSGTRFTSCSVRPLLRVALRLSALERLRANATTSLRSIFDGRSRGRGYGMMRGQLLKPWERTVLVAGDAQK